MPELPEVETIKNAVDTAIKGATILCTEVRQSRLRESVPENFAEQIRHARIDSLQRIAKYMIMNLNNGISIIWHFGMSGKIKIESAADYLTEKHDHIIIKTDKASIIYNDPRRFGLVTVCPTSELKQHHCFKHIGLDPWDDKLTDKYLLHKFAERKATVKSALLNQEIICGIGNIYASEILYRAKILPQRPAESISESEAQKIIHFTRLILEASIKAGGSTIHDYKHPDGDIGYFQNSHCVYNKTGQRCPDCICDFAKTGGIRKITQSGRSTFYCPIQQK